MKLIRFAILTLRTNQKIENMQGEVDGVKLKLSSIKNDNEKDSSFLIEAEIELSELPSLNDKNELIVNEKEREKCEFGIQTLSNLLSVFNACQKSIFSPAPPAVLEYKDENELEYLKNSKGLHVIEKRDNGALQPIEFKPEYISLLSDRLDGVILLSEHYTSGESGKFKELVRFFELSFRLPFVQVEKKLYQFLSQAPYGYTREEIKNWISHRHPNMHADQKKSQQISLTSDIQGFLLRMEQAAIDTLFNKEHWRSSSSLRKQAWKPTAFSTSPKGEMVVQQGTKFNALFRIYDEFGVFPRKLNAQINELKENWYYEYNQPNVPKGVT